MIHLSPNVVTTPRARPPGRVLLVALLLGSAACSEPVSQVVPSQRLVDQIGPGSIVGTPAATGHEPRTPTEWRFDQPPTGPLHPLHPQTRGWRAAAGIAGLRVEDGRLSGRTTSDSPILHFERGSGLDDPDPLHEIRIRLKVSAGTELAFLLLPDETVNFPAILAAAADLPWQTRTPIVAGDLQTYSLESFFKRRSADVRHILLRPTDAAGGSFEIESLRFVFRSEYLAGIPSGIGWHGLANEYRETVVTRVPETIDWDVSLPAKPVLDLAVGTVEERPVTFRVLVGAGTADELLVERTVSTPHRWEEVFMPLPDLAGRQVTLKLSLAAEDDGALGLWGSPAVRNLESPLAAASGGPPVPAGVIFILADTLRADRLDLYGHSRPTAPFLKQMAKKGAHFEDVIAQASWTKASAVSLFTSLYPSSHNANDFLDRLPSSAVTLAEVYRAAGYATVGLSSVPFTGQFVNLHQGFETLHETDFLNESKNAREYVDRLARWLESHRGVPFFAFLHIFDPHSPYEPRSPFNAIWSDPQWHHEHRFNQMQVRRFIEEPGLKVTGTPTRAELETAALDSAAYVERELEWYDGAIRAMDVEVRRLFERLRELGLREKTLVVFASDHGEEFHDHGRMFHGQSIYGELINVPLILHYPPSIAEGTVVKETVELIDVMPTLLDFSGLTAPEQAQGESLRPLLVVGGRESWKRSPAFSEKPATTHFGTPAPRDTESTAILFEGWKLIHNSRRAAGAPEFELYHRRDDPLDQNDVAAQNPDVVARLREHLAAWQKLVLAQRLEADDDAAQGLSSEEMERLRALGYL